MPSVSGAQHRAMAAAASGHSTLGIPADVGSDFMHADKGNPAAKGTKHKDFTDAMKSHGVAKGNGEHKRHPATGHYGMGSRGNRYGK
jgi:hypothetical protein